MLSVPDSWTRQARGLFLLLSDKMPVSRDCWSDRMSFSGRSQALLFVALWLATAAAGSAQADFTGIKKKALLNGLEIYFLPPRNPEISQFVLMIRNGAAFDLAGKWGVTNLMARMLLRGGTKSRSVDLIRQDLEKAGGQIHSVVEWDAIFFHGEAPLSGVAGVLAVLAELLVQPDLTEEDFQREKALVLEVLQEESDLDRRTQRVFQRELFRNNPYSHPVEGTLASVKDLTLMDVKIQYRRLMMPNQAQLALFYEDTDNRLFMSLGRPWGGWVRSDPAPFTFRKAEPTTARRILLIDAPGRGSVIRVGGLTVAKSDRAYYALKVLEHYLTLILPSWAREVEDSRQIQGSVSLLAMKMPGAFQVNLHVPSSRVGDYLERCLRTLDDLAQGQLDQERYKEAKELAFLELKQVMEAPDRHLSELLKANLYSQGLSHLVNYGLRLDRVRQHQLSEVLETYLRGDSLLVVVAGPAAEIQENISRFGPVQILN